MWHSCYMSYWEYEGIWRAMLFREFFFADALPHLHNNNENAHKTICHLSPELNLFMIVRNRGIFFQFLAQIKYLVTNFGIQLMLLAKYLTLNVRQLHSRLSHLFGKHWLAGLWFSYAVDTSLAAHVNSRINATRNLLITFDWPCDVTMLISN